jgi:hypothetical protein
MAASTSMAIVFSGRLFDASDNIYGAHLAGMDVVDVARFFSATARGSEGGVVVDERRPCLATHFSQMRVAVINCLCEGRVRIQWWKNRRELQLS